MDPRRFDRLTKVVSSTHTRRGLVRLVATLPLGMTFSALLGSPDVTAKDDDHGSSHRRHRRVARHRHRPGQDKENNKDQRKGTGKRKGTPDRGGQTGPCAGCTGPGQTCSRKLQGRRWRPMRHRRPVLSGICPFGGRGHSLEPLGCCPACPADCSCGFVARGGQLILACAKPPATTTCDPLLENCAPGEVCTLISGGLAGTCYVECAPLA